jgi:hypothetical protein
MSDKKKSSVKTYTLKTWLWSASLIIVFMAASWMGTELHLNQERNERTMECLAQTERVLELLSRFPQKEEFSFSKNDFNSDGSLNENGISRFNEEWCRAWYRNKPCPKNSHAS